MATTPSAVLPNSGMPVDPAVRTDVTTMLGNVSDGVTMQVVQACLAALQGRNATPVLLPTIANWLDIYNRSMWQLWPPPPVVSVNPPQPIHP